MAAGVGTSSSWEWKTYEVEGTGCSSSWESRVKDSEISSMSSTVGWMLGEPMGEAESGEGVSGEGLKAAWAEREAWTGTRGEEGEGGGEEAEAETDDDEDEGEAGMMPEGVWIIEEEEVEDDRAGDAP